MRHLDGLKTLKPGERKKCFDMADWNAIDRAEPYEMQHIASHSNSKLAGDARRNHSRFVQEDPRANRMTFVGHLIVETTDLLDDEVGNWRAPNETASAFLFLNDALRHELPERLTNRGARQAVMRLQIAL